MRVTERNQKFTTKSPETGILTVAAFVVFNGEGKEYRTIEEAQLNAGNTHTIFVRVKENNGYILHKKTILKL